MAIKLYDINGIGFSLGVVFAIVIILAWLPIGVILILKLLICPTWICDIILLVWLLVTLWFMIDIMEG